MEFIISSRRDFAPTTRNIEDLTEDLVRLAKFNEGAKSDVFLVGGTATALTCNGFHRNHKDLDIALFSRDLDEFYDYLLSQDYRLMTRHTTIPYSFQSQVHALSEVNPDHVKKGGISYLRLLKNREGFMRRVTQRTDYFDLFVIEDRGGSIYFRAHDLIVPKNEFYPIKTHNFKGHEFLIPNLKYKTHIPETRKEDLERICSICAWQ